LQQNPDVKNRGKTTQKRLSTAIAVKKLFAKSGLHSKQHGERLQHQLFFYSDPLQILCSSNSSTVEEGGNQQPSLASSVNYLPKSGNSRKTP
jgi:hypothetical protein